MTKKRKVLSQAEIWDDSALLKSWDEAVEEYQLYHSIHARGEKVEDIIEKTLTRESCTGSSKPKWQKSCVEEDQDGDDKAELEDGELEEGLRDSTLAQQESFGQLMEKASIIDAYLNSGNANCESQQDLPNIPQTLTAESSQDQGLRNLMMSWYWAGYYTGHYEGTAQARQATAQSQERANPS